MCFMIIVILKTNTTIEVYNPFPMINPYTIKLVNVAPIAAAVEETDTYFVISTTGKKNTKAATPANGTVANKTPNEVATALPPLNFKKIEKQCPITAARPYIAYMLSPSITIGLCHTLLASKIYITNITNVPFITSHKPDRRPSLKPNILTALVEPILPLPLVLKSLPAALPIINPNGIEPSK